MRFKNELIQKLWNTLEEIEQSDCCVEEFFVEFRFLNPKIQSILQKRKTESSEMFLKPREEMERKLFEDFKQHLAKKYGKESVDGIINGKLKIQKFIGELFDPERILTHVGEIVDK